MKAYSNYEEDSKKSFASVKSNSNTSVVLIENVTGLAKRVNNSWIHLFLFQMCEIENVIRRANSQRAHAGLDHTRERLFFVATEEEKVRD